MKEEIWKDVPGYKGIYKISNKGKLLSMCRNIHLCDGRTLIIKQKILQPQISKKGYLFQGLSRDSSVSFFRVHRLVAMSFIPNPLNYSLVRHLDDNKMNNNVENLAWGDEQLNSDDAIKNNKYTRGSSHYRSRLVLNTENGIFYYSMRDAAKTYNYNVGYLTLMLNNRIKNKTQLIYC